MFFVCSLFVNVFIQQFNNKSRSICNMKIYKHMCVCVFRKPIWGLSIIHLCVLTYETIVNTYVVYLCLYQLFLFLFSCYCFTGILT